MNSGSETFSPGDKVECINSRIDFMLGLSAFHNEVESFDPETNTFILKGFYNYVRFDAKDFRKIH